MKEKIESLFKERNISGTGHGYIQVDGSEGRVKYWLDSGMEYDFSFLPLKEETGLFMFVVRNGKFSLI